MGSASLTLMSRHFVMTFFLTCCVVAEVRRELTTRSWDAIGFDERVERSQLEDNLIIGIVDSGIWPESASFSPQGLGPPPPKWKGVCQTNNFNFKCNNKIIGARFYVPEPKMSNLTSVDELSPRDNDGHGTHIAATVAGVPVKNASLNGIGLGTARGALPRARIVVYKTCWASNGGRCFFLQRAIDDAVRDGVDMITISIGRKFAIPFHKDTSAIASFNAMRHGILVSFAAGNSGPGPNLIDNISPWALTVGSSIPGPEYATLVTLGDGKTIKGLVMQKNSQKTQLPLVPFWRVSTERNDVNLGKVCKPEFFDPKLTRGKIVLCPSIAQSDFSRSNAAGIIFDSTIQYEDWKESYGYDNKKIPVVAVNSEDFAYLVGYYNNHTTSSGNGTAPATATISKTTGNMKRSPPVVARSSSRGPSIVSPSIMKPDICAPGVNIIAAVAGNSHAFDIYSGTSMATPHAAGIAGYVKTFHPSWSPAAIKSALITTATPMANDKYNNVQELAYGAGQLNPIAAVDPGLVYDSDLNDYLAYICRWSNNDKEVVYNITNDPNLNCSNINLEKKWSLNLPTFSIPAPLNASFVQVFERRVTNVGSPMSNYKAIVSAPKGVEIQLQPSILSFKKLNQTLFYTVTIKGQVPDNSTVLSASFVWTDGHRRVRSPIVIFPDLSKPDGKVVSGELNPGGLDLTMI